MWGMRLAAGTSLSSISLFLRLFLLLLLPSFSSRCPPFPSHSPSKLSFCEFLSSWPSPYQFPFIFGGSVSFLCYTVSLHLSMYTTSLYFSCRFLCPYFQETYLLLFNVSCSAFPLRTKTSLVFVRAMIYPDKFSSVTFFRLALTFLSDLVCSVCPLGYLTTG